eukprot:TRINITY_DN9853_c0_g1_i1.p1 TRINITY_DN9853_c0_g1~~TRINITY_DN9853_c0_g1_i1.p1  ORF type:complete len:518 (+),score=153.51 TRINITY_DN9853_c0_g1_i1:134-1555(+)
MNLRGSSSGPPNLRNDCGFVELERGKVASPKLVGGAVHFAQTRSVVGGVSLRMKVDLTHVRSMHFDLLTCGEESRTSTYVPILFHSSFDGLASGLGPGASVGSISHELEVTSDEDMSRARVFAAACEAPAKSSSFDGELDFSHPILANADDCLTVSIRLRPNRISMWHSREPETSFVEKSFDSLFDIVKQTSCCELPADVDCPSSVDHDYWIGINQIIGVDDGGRDDKSTHRQTNRVKQVAMTFLTEPDECRPCFQGASCNVPVGGDCVPPPVTPISKLLSDGNNGEGQIGDSTGAPNDAPSSGSGAVIAIVVVAIALCLLCLLILFLVAFKRNLDREDEPEYVSVADDFPTVPFGDTGDAGASATPQAASVEQQGGDYHTVAIASADNAPAGDNGYGHVQTQGADEQSAQSGGDESDSFEIRGGLLNAKANADAREDYELQRPPTKLDLLDTGADDDIANYNFAEGGSKPDY